MFPKRLRICRDVVSLPMSAETTEAQVEQIVAALRVFSHAAVILSDYSPRQKKKKPAIG